MTASRNLVRIQEKGQVTLPAAIREHLGLKKGDLVSIVETSQGVLIKPQELIATDALNRIGEALREKGLSLDELIDSGRDERNQLLKEFYDIDPTP
jgi:AbrB family looped-hinge helix DNA binding protein